MKVQEGFGTGDGPLLFYRPSPAFSVRGRVLCSPLDL
jgi:hypothetical protein